MDKRNLEKRTKDFALAIIEFVNSLPKNKVNDVLGYQLLKSGTSIGANYREANRAESKNDFIHKVAIVQKEAAETLYWLELFHESSNKVKETQTTKSILNPSCKSMLPGLYKESDELVAIFTAIGKTSKRNR